MRNLTEVSHRGNRNAVRAIIISIGILIVVMWAMVGFVVSTSRHAALVTAGSEGHNLMVAFREEVALILRGVEAETNLLAEKMRREPGSFDLYAWGQENVLTAPGMANAGIADPNGDLRRSTIEPHPRSINISDRAHFRIQLDGKFHGLYIGETVIARITGLPTLPISRRVEAQDGTFLGVLVILIAPGALTNLHKSIDLGPHGSMTLSGLDDVIRARFGATSPDGAEGVGISIAGGPRPRDIAPNAEGGFERTSLIDGVDRLYAYGRVGGYPLVVTVGLDLHQELAGWRSLATMIVTMALGATLLLAAVGAYLVRQVYRDMRTAQAVTHTAEHDFLTGLPNRSLLNDRLIHAITFAQRHRNKVAVLFLNLDSFKQINGSLGYRTGDQLIQSIGNRLVACVRGSDTVIRQGGDEFIVLLSDVQKSEDATFVARKILQSMAEAHSIGRRELHITTSIGVSIYPEDGFDPDTLLRNANTALLQAKEHGRNSYHFFTTAMNVRAMERQAIEEGLRHALERHEFALHYQPKINLKTGTIVGAEALVRWTHPTRGAISPAEFIPVAEDCGLITLIDTWVFREACEQAQAWVDAGLPAMTIAVNISAVEFNGENFLENLFTILSETRLDPKLLVVELTESLLMKHAEAAASILRALRERGVQVSIDDFGTGYSSLSYLRKFPLDALKIDQSFVRRICTVGGDAPIVVAVIAMAHSLNLRVIAEGVETAEELAFLRAHHCDEVQGYYFSRPVPPEQFARLLETGIPEKYSALLGDVGCESGLVDAENAQPHAVVLS